MYFSLYRQAEYATIAQNYTTFQKANLTHKRKYPNKTAITACRATQRARVLQTIWEDTLLNSQNMGSWGTGIAQQSSFNKKKSGKATFQKDGPSLLSNSTKIMVIYTIYIAFIKVIWSIKQRKNLPVLSEDVLKNMIQRETEGKNMPRYNATQQRYININGSQVHRLTPRDLTHNRLCAAYSF